MPVRRDRGRLVLDLGPTAAEEVERIDVEWPSKRLEDVTLIDTPGIASLSTEVSARAAAFLAVRGRPVGGRRDHLPDAAPALRRPRLPGRVPRHRGGQVGHCQRDGGPVTGRRDRRWPHRRAAVRPNHRGAISHRRGAALAPPSTSSRSPVSSHSRPARCGSRSSRRSARWRGSVATRGNGSSSRSTGSSGRMPRSTCPPTRVASCSIASACSASGCRRSRSAPDATTRPTGRRALPAQRHGRPAAVRLRPVPLPGRRAEGARGDRRGRRAHPADADHLA